MVAFAAQVSMKGTLKTAILEDVPVPLEKNTEMYYLNNVNVYAKRLNTRCVDQTYAQKVTNLKLILAELEAHLNTLSDGPGYTGPSPEEMEIE